MSHQINASASILARMRLALIDLYLAVLSSKSWHTITLVPSHISPAGGAIAAGFVFTVVYLAFTIASCVVSGAFTIVGIPSVDTVTTMVAQLICLEPSLACGCLTRDPGDVTVTSRPAVSTFTGEGSILLATASSILAGR